MNENEMAEADSSQASIQYPPSSPPISTSTVLGMPGQLNPDAVSASADPEEGEFYGRCEGLINGVLGGNDETAARRADNVLKALMAFADLQPPGEKPLDVAEKVDVLQYLQGAVQSAVGGNVNAVMIEASNLVQMATQRSEKSSSGRGGGARKRGGGVGEEAAVDAAIQAVAAADQGNQQPLVAMRGRVTQAVNETALQAVQIALQALGQGLSCAGGAIGVGGGWIIGAIRDRASQLAPHPPAARPCTRSGSAWRHLQLEW